VARGADLEELWDSMGEEEFGEDERIPYWTELWPAGAALCDTFLERRDELRGKFCIDMGCGLGLTAMVAGSLGAKVLCMDYEWDAVYHALGNSRLNGTSGVSPVLMDWRRPAVRAGCACFVWGADILYERRFAPAVAGFLDRALAPDGRAWLADPARNFFKDFEEESLRLGFERVALSRREVSWKGRRVRVYIHEFAKNGKGMKSKGAE
jgi:predicted nicotinamide N-methyase